jgi:hypothetical protein
VDTAHRWGMVGRVTPAGEAEAIAMRLAQAIARYAPLGLALAKQAIRKGMLAAERASFVRCAVSPDFDEGLRAFIEKRAARVLDAAVGSGQRRAWTPGVQRHPATFASADGMRRCLQPLQPRGR